MFGAGLDHAVLGDDKSDASLHRAAEAVAGPVAHSVVLESLVGLLLIIVADETHLRVSGAHLVREDFGAKTQKIQVLGEDDGAVDGGQLRDHIRVGDEFFLLGLARRLFYIGSAAKHKAAGKLVFDINEFFAGFFGGNDQDRRAVLKKAHLPEHSVQELEPLFFRNV